MSIGVLVGESDKGEREKALPWCLTIYVNQNQIAEEQEEMEGRTW